MAQLLLHYRRPTSQDTRPPFRSTAHTADGVLS
jgi:hypothetical protein